MARQILFVQGGGAQAHEDWDRRLVESLENELGSDYEIRYPLMPHESDPSFERWKSALRVEMGKLDDGAIGHSIGAAILIHTLVEEPPDRLLSGIFLVAMPFIGAGG